MPKKILSILGARPHFIKACMVSKAIAEHPHLSEILVHTGQHYDYSLSQVFFEELNLPAPQYNLEVGSGTPLWQMGNILLKLDEVLEKEQPDAIIVYGDTNTTAAGAIAAAKRKIPLAHIEAGLREYNKKIPEEVNKLLTDAVTDLYFCPTQTGVDNLRKEGITENVFLSGDVGIDLIHANKERIASAESILEKVHVEKGRYYFMTCHREANTIDDAKLKEILSLFEKVDAPIVFPVHPRTAKAIQQFDFGDLMHGENVIAIEPIGFWETQALIKHAKIVLTDSGGVIKESYFHKVPAVILDAQSEWIETIDEGWNYIAGPDSQKVMERIHTFETPKIHSNCLGDGHASKRIVKEIANYLNV